MMKFTNTKAGYGLISIVLHWLTAVTVFTLFTLGLWMTSLDYYDPLYQTLPDLHKSLGILLVVVVAGRLLWRFFQVKPVALAEHSVLEKKGGHAAHLVLYVLMFLMLPTGYFISTADGRGIDVFGLFTIPAMITSVDNLEDVAGEIHEWLAFTLIGLAVIHALAAVKHHVIDKDSTLLRMLKPPISQSNQEERQS